MTDLRILSTMALNGVMNALGPMLEAELGLTLQTEFLPTVRLVERIRAGDRGDLAILTDDGAAALAGEGVLEAGTHIARSFIGVAVRAGAPRPDIATADQFVAALHAAGSVVMSQAGASGLYMAGLLERLGIADVIRAKATILSSGYTASLVADGTVELAIQQVSELLMVEGVDIVGRLPASLGGQSVFAAALFHVAPNASAARRLLAALADPARAPLYDRCGLELMGTGAASTV